MSSADINAINYALANIQLQINNVTGPPLLTYNQVTRISAQQGNIYNSLYYGTGNLNTGNLYVSSAGNINGNLIINNSNLIITNGNIRNTIGNIILFNGNIISTIGNINLSNGNINSTNGNMTLSNGNISLTTGNLILNNGSIGILTSSPQANLDVQGNVIINGNLSIGIGNLFMNRFGNLGLGTTLPLATLDISGNSKISGNLNVSSGKLWVDNINNRIGINNTNPQYALDVKGDSNIAGNISINGGFYNVSGYTPVCNASISFRYTSPNIITLYSNNCTISRNGAGSYTVTFTVGPGNTNYIVNGNASGGTSTIPTSVTQLFTGTPALIFLATYKTSTQCLIWISDGNTDGGFDPNVICDLNFFW